MVKIDEDTHKALLLFNRRAEAAEVAASEGKRLTKAVKAKDDAARALKKVQDSGADQEAINEAEAAYRSALKSWQDMRDGVEPEETETEEAELAEEETEAAEAEPAEETEEAELAEEETEAAEAEPDEETEEAELAEEAEETEAAEAEPDEEVEEERPTENE
ncbi:MAG: hypothetical protein ACJZ2F_03395 [Acidimicrobiales bacterium]